MPVFDTGSGDDLITPVYVPPPTRVPTVARKPGQQRVPDVKPCDDEDCVGGSGNGELTTEETIGNIGV